MVYFDRPGLVLLVALATVGPLAGLAVARAINNWRTPTGWDAWYTFLTLGAIDAFVGLVISAWIAQMYDEYKKLSDGVRPQDARDEQPDAETRKHGLIDMNTGKMIYQNNAQTVKIDVMTIKIKRFSRTLVTQHANGFKVDLRERTWEAHFGGRKNYVEARDVRMAGAFAKENPQLPNSPFIVADWRIVESAANGRM